MGYHEYKWKNIGTVLKEGKIRSAFKEKKLPAYFGVGIDERIVEYGWVFSNIVDRKKGNILDAGSVFNFPAILNLDVLKNKNLTIFTYYPEVINYNDRRISYVYGDLRDMPFKDNNFDEIVCQSTIEHVDMDNSLYGYDIKNSSKNEKKSYDYLKVINELYRVLNFGGVLLLTFPFGIFENHGFFQQFDSEMVDRIRNYFNEKGEMQIDFLKYSKEGWNFRNEDDCKNAVSYNPHTGKGKGDDGAAHCRSVCCIKFSKR